MVPPGHVERAGLLISNSEGVLLIATGSFSSALCVLFTRSDRAFKVSSLTEVQRTQEPILSENR
jgi:hypothetical protein